MAKKKRKKSKVHRIASDIILVCLIVIFAVSAYNVGKILYNYWKDQNTYNKVAVEAGTDKFTGDVDFDKLREINPDCIAWIYHDDCEINYPIVSAPDNDRYLHTGFDGNPAGCGTLFTDSTTIEPFNQFLTIVYGHHMKDGSMFNHLKYFVDKSYCDENGRFELITLDQKYHLDVVAFANPKFDSGFYQPNQLTEQAKINYISFIKNNASYLTDVDFDAGDRLVMLSTCAYEYKGARYIVIGKLIPWEEDQQK